MTGRRGRLRGLTAFAVVSLLSLLALGPALAAETATFRFEPEPIDGRQRQHFEVDFPVGSTVEDAVVLTNKTDETREIELYATDAVVMESGAVNVLGRGEARAVGRWITPSIRTVTLHPRDRAVVAVTIERQEETGGLGAIVAQEIGAEAGDGAVDVVFRVALLVDARGPADGTTGLVVGAPRLHAPPSFLPRQADIVVPVTNETAHPVTARLDVSLESLTGRRFGLTPTEASLEPGEQQLVTVPWESVPGLPTVVEATAEAQWSGNTVLAGSGRMLVLPLWLPTLLVLLTAGLVWRGWSNVRSDTEDPAVGQEARASG